MAATQARGASGWPDPVRKRVGSVGEARRGRGRVFHGFCHTRRKRRRRRSTHPSRLGCSGIQDDVDMIADVKQMAAAAAAAGDAVSSFENQLRPIDRCVIRFLELWDPIIDKNAVDAQVQFEKAEWELERIEKLKEDMEAEIDDDEEPFVYESWDTDFATQAYRQQVEALAQHQQLMEELENKAKEEEDAKLDFTMDDDFDVADWGQIENGNLG